MSVNKILRKAIKDARKQLVKFNLETGALLRAQRKEAGISAKCLAGALGISNTMLCDLEKGRRTWRTPVVEAYRLACEKLRTNNK